MLCGGRSVGSLCSRLRIQKSLQPVLQMMGTVNITKHPVMVRGTNFSTDSESKGKRKVTAKGVSKFIKKYGLVAVGTYLTLYAATLSGVFFALDYDWFAASSFGFDPITTTKSACDKFEYYTGVTSLPEYIRNNPRAGTLAIAWVMTKFTEPVRIGLTAMIVPKLGQHYHDKKKNAAL